MNYAVNGLGLGHLTRLIAINRWIRRISIVSGINVEIYFLTTSEGDTLAYQNDFPSFKIPSKNIIKSSGISANNYKKIAKQWIWNAINLCSPDILIVDTFPTGSFKELYDILDFGQKNVFIYRSVNSEIAQQAEFQNILKAYNLILTIKEFESNKFHIPESISNRNKSIGPIFLKNKQEILDRNNVRKQLNLDENSLVCFATAGGGGDSAITDFINTMYEVANSLKEITFVIGTGPLYRGREFNLPNVRWLKGYGHIDYFNGFDFAITAGGFNTIYEIMHCGLPGIFIPQNRLYDDQLERTKYFADNKAGILVDELSANNLIDAILELKDKLNTFSENAKNLVPKNNAPTAAFEILKLLVNEDELENSINLIDEKYLFELAKLGLSEIHTLKIIGALNYFSITSRFRNFFNENPSLFENEKIKNLIEFEIDENYKIELFDAIKSFQLYLKDNFIEFSKGFRFLNSYIKKNLDIISRPQLIINNIIKLFNDFKINNDLDYQISYFCDN